MNFKDFCAPMGSKVKNRAAKKCFHQNFDQNYFFGDCFDFLDLDVAWVQIFGFRQISVLVNFGVKSVGPP